MNKKTWLMKVIDGEDRSSVPVGFWHHFIPHSIMGQMVDHQELIDEYFEKNRQWNKEFDPDFVKIMTDGFLMLPIDIGDGTADGIAHLTVLDPELYINKTMELVSGVRKIYGDDIMMFCNVFSPIITIVKAMRAFYKDDTYAVLAKMLQEEPSKIQAGVDKVTAVLEELVKKAVAPGMADGIYLCVRMCKQSRAAYEKYIAQSERRLLNIAEEINPYNILHICDFDGKQTDISVYTDYPNKVFNWAANSEELPLSEGKKLFAGKTVLGGFGMHKTDILYKGTKEEIEAEARRIVEDAGIGNMIVGADCTVDPGIDVAHLRWAREACRNA